MKKVCKECCDNMQPYDEKILLLIIVPFLALGFILLATYNYPYLRYSLLFIVLLATFIFRKNFAAIGPLHSF